MVVLYAIGIIVDKGRNKMESYQTVYKGGSGEYIEKKSRFIGEIFPINSEEEAIEYIEQVRKHYWDARHHCFAYVINGNQPIERFSDDGEPGGTAGKPILDVIKGAELKNVLIVVTRYFGGTLLGTGGLVRAYTSASREGLSNSLIITRISGFKLKINADYTELGKIQYILGQKSIPVLDTQYTDTVSITVVVSKKEEEFLVKEITESTNAKSKVERLEMCWFAKIGKEIKIFD